MTFPLAAVPVVGAERRMSGGRGRWRFGVASPGSGSAVAVVSAVCFGTSGPFAKALIDAGWSSVAVAVMRLALGAVILLVPMAIITRDRLRTCLSAPWLVIGYGFFGVAVVQLCFFNAVRYLAVPVALLIEYLAPVLVIGWQWVIRGRRPTAMTVVGCVIAIGGMLAVIAGSGTGRIDAIGVLWALGAAVGLAGYFLLAAQRPNTGDVDRVDPFALSAVGLGIGALVVLGVAATGLLTVHSGGQQARLADTDVPWWLVVIAVAVISTGAAYLTGVVAIRALGPLVASFVALSEVVASAVASWILIGQVMTAIQILGGVILIGGIVTVQFGERKPRIKRSSVKPFVASSPRGNSLSPSDF